MINVVSPAFAKIVHFPVRNRVYKRTHRVQKGKDMMENGRNVTIYDIAREAGVSVATVSRVLTGNARVSKEKREKIESLIKKYDFKPNALAKSLRETKSRVIGMIMVDFTNPFYATLLSVCEREASSRGYSLIVSSTIGRAEMEEKYLDNMYEQRVAAIVKVGGIVDRFIPDMKHIEHMNRIANSIPIVITGTADGADCYQVKIDEMKACELVMDYLLELGHKKIAIVGGSAEVRQTVEKRLKYKQILQRNGITFNEEFIVEGDYNDKSGYREMKKLLELGTHPTAVIAINDFTAIGIIRAAFEMGLRIPQDISVVSFDDTFITNICHPRLTSVSLEYEEFGKKLVDTAIDAIEGKEPMRKQMVLPRLIVRDSCRFL